MEVYKPELEKTEQYFQSVPGRFSEKNVRKLGTHNHFETFEDAIPGGRRLSLSGSIVVIDIDLVSDQVSTVSASLASGASPDDSFRFMAPVNRPEQLLLESMRLPRLNKFASMLGFLSRCDRFSTKTVDCFEALDSISKAIMSVASKNTTDASDGFGIPQMNVDKLGLGLWWAGSEQEKLIAYLDVREGSQKEYMLRMRDEWLDSKGQWIDAPAQQDESDSSRDTRAELILRFSEPALIGQYMALKYDAEFKTPAIPKGRIYHSTFNLERHPELRKGNEVDTLEINVANVTPYNIVEVTQIPLKSPKDIPHILNAVRRARHVNLLLNSVLSGRPLVQVNEIDLSIADALELRDKPVQYKSTTVYVQLQSAGLGDTLEFTVTMPQTSTLMRIAWAPGEVRPQVTISKPVNIADLEVLVEANRLDLAISYILGSIGAVARRQSSSVPV